MLIARKLKQDNIAEYLLYMWQVEDLIRANGLDIDKIESRIINKFDEPADVKSEIKKWYINLIEMMHLENVPEKGHLIIIQNTIADLSNLHIRLIKSTKHENYITTYYKTLPFIVELRAKSQNNKSPEIETCFSALYGFLLMRLQQKEISGETQAAISQISTFLRLLSQCYNAEREGTLELD